jgi:hypothetical protein
MKVQKDAVVPYSEIVAGVSMLVRCLVLKIQGKINSYILRHFNLLFEYLHRII